MVGRPQFSLMLHNLRPATGSRKTRKRVARGNAGKGGTTAGRGTKGQQSRSGKGMRHGFEGGQMPLIRRQPKLGGFKRPRRVDYEALNLSTLEARLPEGKYSLNDLRGHALLRTKKPVKLLATGKLSKKFELEAHAASKTAKDALKKAGGTLKIVKA